MGTDTKLAQENPIHRGRKAWRAPRLQKLGTLSMLTQSSVPGKPSLGQDGGGQGGGEEMWKL